LAFNDIAGNETKQQFSDTILFVIMHLSKLHAQYVYIYIYIYIYVGFIHGNI